MPTLTVRQLDDDVYQGLKNRAEKAGRSMEAEARAILESAVSSYDWWQRWVEATEPLRGEDLPIPPRSPAREPPDFS
jgi:plasmid stability protein